MKAKNLKNKTKASKFPMAPYSNIILKVELTSKKTHLIYGSS